MGFSDVDPGQSADGSYAAMWRLVRQRAHQLATLRRDPTDRELDDFTRLVERLRAPRALHPSR
jgi:hypothetical protein